jgi:hypothetical protein
MILTVSDAVPPDDRVCNPPKEQTRFPPNGRHPTGKPAAFVPPNGASGFFHVRRADLQRDPKRV